MKKLLIAAGIVGAIVYLKKNPKLVDDLTQKAKDAYDKYSNKTQEYTA